MNHQHSVHVFSYSRHVWPFGGRAAGCISGPGHPDDVPVCAGSGCSSVSAFGAFQALAVEVNDRLRASPTVMIVMTAAVIFGRDSAAIGAATIVVFGAITPIDIQRAPVVSARS